MTTTKMTMSQLRSNLAGALDQATAGHPVVVTRHGKTDAVLVDADLLDDILAASNPRIINKIKRSRKDNDIVSFEEAFSEL